jgi:hypothetical protein
MRVDPASMLQGISWSPLWRKNWTIAGTFIQKYIEHPFLIFIVVVASWIRIRKF